MTPKKNNTQNIALSKSKPRGKLKHALIDVNFFNCPNVIALRRKFGPASPGAIVAIICQISQTENAELDVDTALGVMDLFQIDHPEACLNYCYEKEILTKISESLLTHLNVIKDQEACARKRAKWRCDKDKNQNTMESQADSATDSVVESTVESVGVSTEKCEDIEDLNTEDLNPNPKQGGSKGGDPPQWTPYAQNLPESLDNPDIRHALGAWLYKQTQLHKPRDQLAVEALAANWANRPKEFLASLRESTANGWKTLIEPKSTAGPPGRSKITYEKETNFDRNLRNILEA